MKGPDILVIMLLLGVCSLGVHTEASRDQEGGG